MMAEIFTYGYTGATPADLAAYVAELDAYLIDIRYNPTSRVPRWRQDALRALVGVTEHGRARYRHIGELGNVNYNTDGPIVLYAPEEGVREIAPYLAARPCILLCGCRDWQACHRRAAAALIAEALGGTITHLAGRYTTNWREGLSALDGMRVPTPGWRLGKAVAPRADVREAVS